MQSVTAAEDSVHPEPLHSTPSPREKWEARGGGGVPRAPADLMAVCLREGTGFTSEGEHGGQATWVQPQLCTHCLTLRWSLCLSVPQFPHLTTRVMIALSASQGCSENKQVDAHNTFRTISGTH